MGGSGYRRVVRRQVARAGVNDGPRDLATETPIALVHDGSTTAVMMASPTDLEDFAVGFSLTEGIIDSLADVTGLEVVTHEQGAEARVWLRPGLAARIAERRRHMAGPTGCGLCGIESLEAATRSVARSTAPLIVRPADIAAAVAALADRQPLGQRTRATHAAGLYRPGEGLLAVREDVGRHNALDKLVGHAARAGVVARDCLVVITSRVSVEIIQKTAALGAPVIAAVSAPTTLAVSVAEAAGLTLIAVVREDGFEVFTGVERVIADGDAASF